MFSIIKKRLGGGAYKILLVVFLIFVGFIAGFFLRDILLKKIDNATITYLEKREGGFRFINPLLECDAAEDNFKNKELRPFKDIVEKHIHENIDNRRIENLSVYFRELNDGLWFSIGDKEKYTPASMRKVPMMIAVLKQTERDPGLFKRKIKSHLLGDYDSKQNFQPSQKIKPGADYSIDDLIRRMIVYSDNNAFMMLSGIVDPEELQKVYYMLSMRNPESPSSKDDYLSVFTYASFFRILFNASYLNREMSEKALLYLSEVEFNKGITAGLPATIAIAHKFGEHSEGDAKQLHDCGIIYYPRHPYLLCIMSRGDNFDYLSETISSISVSIYSEVDKQHIEEHQ